MPDLRSILRRVKTRAQDRAKSQALRAIDQVFPQADTLQRAFDLLPALMHAADPAGRLVRVTDAWLARLGYSRPEVLGRPWVDFLTPASRQYALDVALPALLREDRAADLALEFVHQDTRPVTLRLSGIAVRDPAGALLETFAVLCEARDSALDTQLKETLAAAGCLVWTGLLARAPDAGVTCTCDVLDEAAAQGFFALARRAGRRWLEDFSASIEPEDAVRLAVLLENHLADSPTSYTAEFRARGADGALRWFAQEVRIVPLGADHWRATGICTDITARQRAEDQFRAATRAAEHASRAKSVFLANMSHEIRTPMTAILGYCEMLLDPALPAAQRSAFLHTIQRNGQHLLGVINNILDLSKIEAGQIAVDASTYDLMALLEDVRATLQPRAAEKHLTLHVVYDTQIPREIRTDVAKVRGILVNLVGNALKFTERGAVTLRVSARRDEHILRLAIAVHDTGIGIAPAAREKIFLPFTQADASASRVFGGTGLGLTISRKLAQLLGGDITLESELGRGSTFTLSVTAAEAPGTEWLEAPSDRPAPADTPAAPAAVACGARVLLAEDSPDNQALITHLLTRAGVQVTLAENGRVAVDTALAAQAGGHAFDLIFMDMQMPELDGYQATTLLRTHGYQRPIVALTANAMTGDREKCLRAGCDDFATKPVQRETLVEIVRRYTAAAVPARPAAASPPSADSRLEALLQRFIDGLPRRVDVMRQALAAQDLAGLRRLVHQLKGAAGSYGFPHLTTAALALEHTMSASQDITAIATELSRLADLCAQTSRKKGAMPISDGHV